MANPNITRLGTLNAKNFGFKITTDDPVILIATDSFQSVKINSLYITNTNVCGLEPTIDCYVSDGVDNFYIANDIVIPLGTSIILIDKEGLIYLQPNQYLAISSNITFSIDGVISYDLMSE